MASTAKPELVVEIRQVQSQPYLAKRVHAPMAAVGQVVQDGFDALYGRLKAAGSQPAGPPFMIAEVPKDGYLDMELGAPCAGIPPDGGGFESRTLPAGKVAVTVHRGSYDSVGQVYPELAAWISASGLTMAGPPREVYLTPPGENPVTEVAWPIR